MHARALTRTQTERQALARALTQRIVVHNTPQVSQRILRTHRHQMGHARKAYTAGTEIASSTSPKSVTCRSRKKPASAQTQRENETHGVHASSICASDAVIARRIGDVFVSISTELRVELNWAVCRGAAYFALRACL
eukprot:6204173-Pleurochrysis_carterae.AAC.1